MTRCSRVLAIAALMASLGCASPAPPAQNVDADKAKLQADATSWFDFYAKADGDGMANGAVTGVDVSGDIGWISGNYTVVDGSGAAVDSGSYLSAHRRDANGVWLYTRDIWNSDRAPQPAQAPAPK